MCLLLIPWFTQVGTSSRDQEIILKLNETTVEAGKMPAVEVGESEFNPSTHQTKLDKEVGVCHPHAGKVDRGSLDRPGQPV